MFSLWEDDKKKTGFNGGATFRTRRQLYKQDFLQTNKIRISKINRIAHQQNEIYAITEMQH